MIIPELELILKLVAVIIPETNTLLHVRTPDIFVLPWTKSEVPEEPTAPTVRLTLSSGLVVPIPTLRLSTGWMPVPRPAATPANRESFCNPVNPEPSPVNAVATTDPLNLDSPTTRSLNPFAVDPIPTPSLSTATIEVPDPTWNVDSPGDVVAIPTWSKVLISASLERLTLPKRLHAFSTV